MTEITNPTFMLQEAQEKARSFPTLKPPNDAVYLGSVEKTTNTYNYYVDGEGKYWYDSDNEYAFKLQMIETEKRQKNDKRKRAG